MVLDGRSIIDKKLVTFSDEEVDTEDQIQPNGVDLRVNKIYSPVGTVLIPQQGKVEAKMTVNTLKPKEGKFYLAGGQSYWIDFLENINVAEGYCATLITRSSVERAGATVVAGLYDTGFYGNLGCTLRVYSNIEVEWGAKLCQVLFLEAEFNGVRYSGRYQGTSQTELANGT